MELDLHKSAVENAEVYYNIAKKMKRKKEGAEEALKKIKVEKKSKVKKREVVRRGEWYEKYRYFFTSGGKLCIGGKNADQNEELVKRHFEEEDLFFHADVIGGSVVILKRGKNATLEEKVEAAQFALCFSKLWKEGSLRGNAYAVEREGVVKTYKGSKAERGNFFIIGEREWYKSLLLELKIYYDEEEKMVYVVPGSREIKGNYVRIRPGRIKKGEAVRRISAFLNVEEGDVEGLLPVGRYEVKEVRV